MRSLSVRSSWPGKGRGTRRRARSRRWPAGPAHRLAAGAHSRFVSQIPVSPESDETPRQAAATPRGIRSSKSWFQYLPRLLRSLAPFREAVSPAAARALTFTLLSLTSVPEPSTRHEHEPRTPAFLFALSALAWFPNRARLTSTIHEVWLSPLTFSLCPAGAAHVLTVREVMVREVIDNPTRAEV